MGGEGVDKLTSERREASTPMSRFTPLQLSPRAKIDARRFEIADASDG
jgi:hypothetical protein